LGTASIIAQESGHAPGPLGLRHPSSPTIGQSSAQKQTKANRSAICFDLLLHNQCLSESDQKQTTSLFLGVGPLAHQPDGRWPNADG
jgi:hypothetical protein